MSACAPVTSIHSRRCQRRSWSQHKASLLRRAATAILLALVTILVSTAPASSAANAGPQPSCDIGVFCAWQGENYAGPAQFADVRTAGLQQCAPLDHGMEARSFVNRTDRPVTVYQGTSCSTEGDFTTYPGGTFIPRAPFIVRAIQIWPH